MLQEITNHGVKVRSGLLKVFLASIILVYIGLNIYSQLKHDSRFHFFLQMTYFSILAVLYVSVIVLLNQKMRKLQGNFRPEIKSIKL